MPEPIVHNPKANAIAKGVKQFSNVEKICWGRVSGLGNSPQGKVYDSMQVYLPVIEAAGRCKRSFTCLLVKTGHSMESCVYQW